MAPSKLAASWSLPSPETLAYMILVSSVWRQFFILNLGILVRKRYSNKKKARVLKYDLNK